jgi:hypothetical protein
VTTTLRTSTGDLVVPRVIVRDPASVAVQTIRDGLALWKGSWFLDTNAGFPWLLFLGVKILNANQLIAALRAFLLSVPGIVNVIATATFNRAARSFSYDYSCTFNSGAIITGGSGAPANLQGGSWCRPRTASRPRASS